MVVLDNIMTIQVYSHPDYPNREIILAIDPVERFQGVFLLDRETQIVTRREWVSLDLPENVLMNTMWEILRDASLKRSVGRA